MGGSSTPFLFLSLRGPRTERRGCVLMLMFLWPYLGCILDAVETLLDLVLGSRRRVLDLTRLILWQSGNCNGLATSYPAIQKNNVVPGWRPPTCAKGHEKVNLLPGY